MERRPRTLSTPHGWRARLSLLASTLAVSSALNAWVGGETAARGAQPASAPPPVTGAQQTIGATGTTTTPTGTTTTPTLAGTTTTPTGTTRTPAGASPTATNPPPAGSSTTTTSTTPPPAKTTTSACPATKPRSARGAAKGKAKQNCSPSGKSHASSKHSRGRAGTKASPGTGGAGLPAAPAPAAASGDAASTVAAAPSPTTDVLSAGLGVGGTGLGSLAQVVGDGELPPSNLIPIYQAAGRRYDIPWQVLAAINGIETNYGQNVSASSAGAIGWMQFMPATWNEYAVSVSGQGTPNPYDPRDAIFAAAHLLAANGGAHHLRQAIYAYNHAGWYVDAVLWREQLITDWAAKDQHTSSLGYALPLAGKYMRQLGRTDEGVDIETAPDGAAVYAMTPGVVTAVASDPTGFGPNYPVIRVTSGVLAGHYIYYGHVAASLVHVGEHVTAGEPIAVMGHTGDAASLGHGHIEIGFSDAGGDPLDHPGTAATASGAAMRGFLVELSRAFGIHNS